MNRVVGTWRRTAANLVIAGLGVLIVGGAAAAAPARLAGIGPAPLGKYAFDGSLSSVPLKPTDIKLTKPQCSPLTPGAPIDCQVKLDVAVKDREVLGSLNDLAHGITGRFNASCDITGKGTAAFQAAKQQIEITKIDASSGSQRCDWSANFSNGGRIAGVLEGTKLGFAFSGGASPLADLVSSMRLSIVGGSGAFNGVRGSGVFDQNLRVALPLLTLDSAVDKAINAALGGLGGLLTQLPLIFPSLTQPAAPPPSQVQIKVVGAKPTAFITEPAHTVAFTNDRLVVITAPGATCSALATQESPLARRPPSAPVFFAPLADRDRNGSVEFAGRLKSRLALGLWSIKATCESRIDTYRGSQLIKTEMVRASATRRLTVTLTSPG